MYFISNDALATGPDNKFFLLKLRPDELQMLAEIRLLSSSLAYQLPPDALQKNSDRKLNTNDARIQDGFYAGNSIYFVLNSAITSLEGIRPGIFFGQLHDVNSHRINGEFMADTFETAFASLTPLPDEGFMFVYSYSSSESFPGISVIYRDMQGQYSKPVKVAEGNDYVMFWGDYNKICKHPAHSSYWISAGYGINDGTIAGGELATCIAKIELTPVSEIPTIPSNLKQLSLYPNPSRNNRMTALFHLNQSQILDICIYDITGKLINTVVRESMPPGTHRISFSTAPLARGTYILLIKGQKELSYTEKFIVE
jgi:hypothetical protein